MPVTSKCIGQMAPTTASATYGCEVDTFSSSRWQIFLAHFPTTTDWMMGRFIHILFSPYVDVAFLIFIADHCRGKDSFDEATNQKLVETHSIPLDIKPRCVKLTKDGMNLEVCHRERLDSYCRCVLLCASPTAELPRYMIFSFKPNMLSTCCLSHTCAGGAGGMGRNCAGRREQRVPRRMASSKSTWFGRT